MSQSTQTDQDDADSIVQPGAALNPSLPEPLAGELQKLGRGPAQGAYSDIYKGMWIVNEKDMRPVCLKMLRQVHMEPSKDPMEIKERFRRVGYN